jgi:hypothetical protein
VFGQFLAGVGRTDLARGAQEAKKQGDADLALNDFISRLPAAIEQGPRLGLHPRRLNIGSLRVGESRQIQLTIQNEGKGLLHGNVAVAEGTAWLSVGLEKTNGECAIKTRSEQVVVLRIDTRALSAPQKYSGKLTVITNGGIVEVPIRLDVVVQPFEQGAFHDVSTPREMAERMRSQPKQAVPLLESGEIAAWFASNGWSFPVSGPIAKGIAGVQQFFEGMGLSKPPTVRLAETNLQLFCNAGETVSGQFTLRTEARKWVYANASADVPWIRFRTPSATGPQQATMSFEAASRGLRADQAHLGTIRVVANAGQELQLPVRLGVLPAEPAEPVPRTRRLNPILVGATAAILIRLLIALPADLYARALAPVADGAAVPGSLAAWAQPAHTAPSYAPRLVMATFWLGTVLGAIALGRAGKRRTDILFGGIAGVAAGLAAGGTLAVLLPTFDVLARFLMQKLMSVMGSAASGAPWLWSPVWIIVAALCWGLVGGVVGALLGVRRRGRGAVMDDTSGSIARLLGTVGLTQTASALATSRPKWPGDCKDGTG